HAFVGMPGSNNDRNALGSSPLISEYIDENAPQFLNEVYGHRYDFLYYSTDGTYPDCRSFVKTISAPINKRYVA
ncbi:hypothetical protein PHYSODRAFT_534998, partial [Phytophthora sojae]